MRDWPTDLTEADLVAGLGRGWGLDVRAVDYLPLGAGSYHWSAVVRGGPLFVTVDDLGPDEAGRQDACDRLDRALTTAGALHDDAGLDFVVAPIPTRTGGPTWRTTSRYAMSVFPMVDGTAGHFGTHPPDDRAPLVDLLAALHLATPTVATIASRTTLRLPGRDGLERALADTHDAWRTGPYAEPARALLAANTDRMVDWLAEFDRLVTEVQTATATWVITHGEPHPGNVLRTATGRRLIDWDTTELAPPERDLWLLTTEPLILTSTTARAEQNHELLERYTAATGLPVSTAALALYRLWWTLADLAVYAAALRRPHGPGGDAAATLTYLASYLAQEAH